MNQVKQKKILLLDRDGVINYDSANYIKSPEEWTPIPGSLETIAALYKNNFHIIVVTNQSGVGRGYYSVETLNAMHAKMCRLLGELGGQIAAIYFCPHHPDDLCSCRKPNTGMLDKIEQDFNLSLTNVPYIGDTDKDIKLATNKACMPILVRTGKGRDTEIKYPTLLKGVPVFDSLSDAGQFLLNQDHFED